MIPANDGEVLPACPNHCVDNIWTFFNDKSGAAPTESREATDSFQALDLTGEPRAIPAGATLTDVRFGPEDQGGLRKDRNVAAFRFDGRVYFGSADALFQKTKVIQG
jgi:hypothetical protein